MLDETLKSLIRDAFKRVADATPHFHRRLGQRQMIATLARQLGGIGEKSDDDDTPENRPPAQIAVVEGPTGTGKTFAYLLASIPIALARKRPLIISTGTVALQDQLMLRDVPALRERSGLEFSAVLAKGRGRYVCPHKLIPLTDPQSQQALWEQPPNSADLATLSQLKHRFIEGGWDGDRDTLTEAIDERLWHTTTTDANNCLRQHCAYFNQCPFFRARAGLRSAQVIVANHDLVLADLALGGGAILPPPADSIYVFDEAHHLADKAIQHFQHRVTLDSTRATLERNHRHLNTRAGLGAMERINHDLETLSAYLDEINVALRQLHQLLLINENFPEQHENERIWRFSNGQLPEGLREPLENLYQPANAAQKCLDLLNAKIEEALRQDKLNVGDASLLMQSLGPITTRVNHLADTTHALLEPDPAQAPPTARWIRRHSRSDRPDDFTLEAAPVWPAGLLRSYLWDRCAGAVLTSATLTALGNFDHFLRSVGLANDTHVITEQIASPFDLQNNAVLRVPYMHSSPKDNDQHTAELIAQLPPLLSDGRAALVLFSARRQMNAVYDALPQGLKRHVLSQEHLPKAALLELHRQTIDAGKPSYIFGLASFSEGVDLQGKYCEHVIIAKLDFQVPDDPVLKTLSEWMETQGRNAFIEISLPNASRKLIQACGRLIRTETDTGTITLLDRRVVTQRYGKQLLRGLPPYRLEIEKDPPAGAAY
jgi:ATP-dependent DNA helicase DinG